MNPVSIVLAVKNRILRSHLVDFLTQAGMKVLAETDDLLELKDKAKHCKPCIILLDIEIWGDELADLLRRLKQTQPQTKLVLTGPEPQTYYARHVLAMGADLYLSVEENPHEWTRKIRGILEG